MTPSRTPRSAAHGPPDPPPVDRLQVALEAAYRTEDAVAAFEHFRPLVTVVPVEGLAIFNGNALVMKVNIETALTALTPHVSVVYQRMPAFDLASLLELPSLALALDHASERVPAAPMSAGEIDAMFGEARPLRALTMAYLDVASHPLLNLVPADRVRAIREGTGPLDTARDCVSVPALFREYEAKLAGKHPFPPEMLARLSSLGNSLVANIRPKNAPAAPPARSPDAIARDQLAHELEDRYDALGVALSVAVGRRKADELLPALRSSVVSATKTPATPPTPPTPA